MLKDIIILGGGSRRHGCSDLQALRCPRSRSGSCAAQISASSVLAKAPPQRPRHLFDYLGISRRRKFYEVAEPTWKLGIHFLWGPRPSFEYTFEPQLDARSPELPRPNGYYCDEDFNYLNLSNALMTSQKAFARQPNGSLLMQENFAFPPGKSKAGERCWNCMRTRGSSLLMASSRQPSAMER